MLLVCLTANARQQPFYDNRLTLEQEEKPELRGDSLYIGFRLDFDRLRLETDRSLTLTPLLAGKDTVRMKPVVLNGRNRHRVYRRDLSLGLEQPGTYYAVVKTTGRAKKSLVYRDTLLFEPWMAGATVILEEDLCGCGGHTEELARESLFAVELPQPFPPAVAPEPFEPVYSYLSPAPEKIKMRTELKDIYLNFPVNKVVIYPDYMDNRRELAGAQEMIMRINTDTNLCVSEVVIRGYASPEGSVPSNYRLSKGRAAALKNYLASRLHDSSLPMRSESGGEDWNSVIEKLQVTPITGRDELLAAIRDCDRSDAAETALRQLGGGRPYREMLREIYPKVRRSLCSVNYTAREFTVEESRTVIRLHPEQLSLYEMWRLAYSYPENSDEFKEVMRIAVRTFPADDTALLNAAGAELADGQYDLAAGYLARIRQCGPAYENACGILSFYRKEYEEAAARFRKAAEGGSEAARHNLTGVEKEYANTQNND